MSVQCHYEILGVDRSADAATIKKAHRKLALRLHPDKNADNHDAAAEQFRLVQEAYECLSDPTERKWYDDHREAILKGWSASDNNSNAAVDMLFDVTPFMHPSCYVGYQEDTQDSFYAVYRRVFAAIYDEEQREDEFDPDQDANAQNGLQRDFGIPDTPWEQVSLFYQLWDSFASRLNFAWADTYDVTEAENRRIRRAIEDENRKARRSARKSRNEEIQALVRFVKRRDPRVRERRKQMEEEKLQKEKELKEASARRKKEAIQAREQWRQQAEEDMAVLEEVDRAAGRVRLADLEDDYDYGGKKGKRGKKKKGRGKQQDSTKSKVSVESNDSVEAQEDGCSIKSDEEPGGKAGSTSPDAHDDDERCGNYSTQTTDSQLDTYNEESSDEESEEPDVWRCECCKKDFKSEGQMENHMRSKKHKEAYKKYLAKLERLEQQLLDEMLDE